MHAPETTGGARRSQTLALTSARRGSGRRNSPKWLRSLRRVPVGSIQAAAVSVGLLVLSLVGVWVTPIPYVTVTPGQSTELLVSGSVHVDGVETPTSGAIQVPGVNTTPQDGRVNFYQGLWALIDPSSAVVVRESVYAFGRATSEQQATAQDDPTGDYRDAVVAGLVAAGRTVRPLPLVSSVSSSGPSYGKLQAGDLIISVNSTVVSTRAELSDLVTGLAPGTTVRIQVLREGVELELLVPTVAAQSDPNQSRLGIEVVNSYQYEDRVTVDLSTSSAGNEAGLAVALAVYEQLAGTGVVGDHRIAAVGIVQPSGEVGQVNNIRQYLASASRGGAEMVLVPAGNCGDVAELSPRISVVKVSTVQEATRAVAEYTRNPESSLIPRC